MNEPAVPRLNGLSTRKLKERRFLKNSRPAINVRDPDHSLMDVDRGVRRVWWSPSWIPVINSERWGDYLRVYLDPAKRGTMRQVLTYYHDETFRDLVAFSMGALLTTLTSRWYWDVAGLWAA